MTTQTATKAEVSGAAYAVAGDFCRIFADNMDSLYRLSLFLTVDPIKAEQCFVSGLEDSRASNRVFKEWAQSWARRTVVQNAIRLIGPARKHSGPVVVDASSAGVEVPDGSPLLAALFTLPTFERFVFVMSILEKLSDQDCTTLLGCARQDVAKARMQAVKRLAASAQRPGTDVAIGGNKLFMQRRLLPEMA